MGKDYEIFEKVVASIYEQLSKNCIVKHNDKINGRQIDVSIRTSIGGVDLLVIVQCKKFKTKLDVTYVDELFGTMQDVGAHRGVLVSVKGFSGRAIQRAPRCAIDLCVVKDAENRDWKLDLKIPVVYELIHPLIQMTFDVQLKTGDDPPRPEIAIINGVSPWDKFKKVWSSGSLNFEPGQHTYDFDFVNPVLELSNGQKRDVKNVRVIYRINKHLSFGYIDDVPKTKLMDNISAGKRYIIIDGTELSKHKVNFISIRSISEAPIKDSLFIRVLEKPDLDNEMKAFFGYRRIGDSL